MQACGRVIRKAFGSSTKSAHMAVVLDTGNRQYVLRRRGGNAFRDAKLDELVGKEICCSGQLHGYVLLLNEWNEITLASQ